MNFMKFRKVTYILSLTVFIFSLTSIFFLKGFNFGIDFTGGVLIQVKFYKTVSENQIRDALSSENTGNIVIQRIGQPKENIFIIKSKIISENTETLNWIQENLITHFEKDSIQLPFQKSELVGPAIGKDLRNLAYLLIVISLIAILIYISVRFQFKFAIAAIVALVHDVIFTLGIFSFFEKEINIPIVAAVLTIIGYSLNDTIVVFDRIRENMKIMHGQAFDTIINISIKTTLNRTIITSLTTLLAVLSLYLWGGTVIHDFAFAFLIGILVGTYSSIFVASPVLYDWWKIGSKNRKK
ncbi:MAG: protein translocase subunit SecF [Spirochaetes bacterium]|nr:protein translocase subunit SecF [Spirochaetota bacterium]